MEKKEIEHLVLRAKADEALAYEILFCVFTPYIKIWCNKLRIPNYSYDDLNQECFLYLVHAIEKYHGTDTFIRYATKTIKNNLLYLLREQIKLVQMPYAMPYDNLNVGAETMDSIENFVITSIENNIIDNAIKSLTPVEKKIISDYYFNDINLRSISNSMDMKYITTVKKKDAALKKLKKLLLPIN